MVELLSRLLIPADGAEGILFWARHLLLAMVIFSIFWCMAQLLTAAINRWGSRFAAFTKTDLDDRIVRRVTPSISLLFTLTGLYYALLSLPLHERFFNLVTGGLYVSCVIVFCMLLYRILHEVLNWYAETRMEGETETFSGQIAPVLEKVIMLFVSATALIVVLKHFNYDVMSLLTALGVGSLALGMAAKDTLAQMISGFTLMFDRPFRVGDRILVTGGVTGDIQSVGLRTTKIKTLDNQLVIIPNSNLCNSTLTNQAYPDSRIKGRINIGVGYNSDVEQVKQLLVSIALEVDEVLRDPPPDAFFASFGDCALNMALFFWVDEYSRLFAVTDMINIKILNRFRAQGIEIPFPIRTIQLNHEQGRQTP